MFSTSNGWYWFSQLWLGEGTWAFHWVRGVSYTKPHLFSPFLHSGKLKKPKKLTLHIYFLSEEFNTPSQCWKFLCRWLAWEKCGQNSGGFVDIEITAPLPPWLGRGWVWFGDGTPHIAPWHTTNMSNDSNSQPCSTDQDPWPHSASRLRFTWMCVGLCIPSIWPYNDQMCTWNDHGA